MIFRVFFDELYFIPEVNQAFEKICTDKMRSDGYFDMSLYIHNRIKKDEMYAQLLARKSDYAVFYKGAYPDQDNALIKWQESIEESKNLSYSKTRNTVLTYQEASAIVNWVYRALRSIQEREQFTKELLKNIKELQGTQYNVKFSKGVAYNAAKVELQFCSSVTELSSIVSELKKPGNPHVFYRGHASSNYIMLPSIMRTPGLQNNESTLYNELMINCPEDFENCHTHLERLVKMQHYGLPTRLLDITRNMLVALFFACENHHDTYGELIMISASPKEIKYPQSDTVSILASLPALSAQMQKTLCSLAKNAAVSNLQFNSKADRLIHEVRLEKPAFQPDIRKEDVLNSYIVYALKNNSRIVKQDGAFILCGLDNQSGFLEHFRYKHNGKKVVVLIDNKKDILNQLETFSINRASLFPEIECVSEYLANKYM